MSVICISDVMCVCCVFIQGLTTDCDVMLLEKALMGLGLLGGTGANA